MGRKRSERPERLNEKLRAVRENLGLTQIQMYEALSQKVPSVHPGYVSLYETGERIPSLLVALAYARIGNFQLELLIDDEKEIVFDTR